MSDEKRKLEPPFHLDMPFEEALTRYAHTDAAEVQPPAGKKRKVPKKAKEKRSLERPTEREKGHPN